MRHESSVTSISWIPQEAMTGPMRVPMDFGIGHYDQAPPDQIRDGDLEELRDADRYRFANDLSAWVEVDEGRIVDAGYSGGGLVGSTTARVGISVTIPGVAFPVLQETPVIESNKATFHQTAGGRTGAPLPHRIDRPPFIRMTAPPAWTTLTLTLDADGTSEFECVGASAFPRHWIYGPDGAFAAESGVIDFADWTHSDDPGHTPWHHFDRAVLMSHVESQVERNLAPTVMASHPDLVKIDEGSKLIEQGQPGSTIYLVVDGMLRVEVDGEEVAELGPGAIVGERAVLEGGIATATVTAMTKINVARLPVAELDRSDLNRVAAGHHQEEN